MFSITGLTRKPTIATIMVSSQSMLIAVRTTRGEVSVVMGQEHRFQQTKWREKGENW